MKEFSLTIIEPDIFIVDSTPFLYLKNHSLLILGDLHLGQEQSLFAYGSGESGEISRSSRDIFALLLDVSKYLEIKQVILNGDIKHATNNILKQELQELQELFTLLQKQDIRIIMNRGNHDNLLEYSLNFAQGSYELRDFTFFEANMELGNEKTVLVLHGHQEHQKDVDLIILSHEHPAFVLRERRVAVKLPAFACIYANHRGREITVIILPPANAISAGVSYPPRRKTLFMSPILQNLQQISSIYLYPFDKDIGVLEIPPFIRPYDGQK